MIFYEAPHKLAATLSDLYKALGDRKLAIVREITKIHEQIINTTLSDASVKYADNSLKGELVLIIEGFTSQKEIFTLDQAVALAKENMSQGLSVNESAKLAAKKTGIKKSDIYKALSPE